MTREFYQTTGSPRRLPMRDGPLGSADTVVHRDERGSVAFVGTIRHEATAAMDALRILCPDAAGHPIEDMSLVDWKDQ